MRSGAASQSASRLAHSKVRVWCIGGMVLFLAVSLSAKAALRSLVPRDVRGEDAKGAAGSQARGLF